MFSCAFLMGFADVEGTVFFFGNASEARTSAFSFGLCALFLILLDFRLMHDRDCQSCFETRLSNIGMPMVSEFTFSVGAVWTSPFLRPCPILIAAASMSEIKKLLVATRRSCQDDTCILFADSLKPSHSFLMCLGFRFCLSKPDFAPLLPHSDFLARFDNQSHGSCGDDVRPLLGAVDCPYLLTSGAGCRSLKATCPQFRWSILKLTDNDFGPAQSGAWTGQRVSNLIVSFSVSRFIPEESNPVTFTIGLFTSIVADFSRETCFQAFVSFFKEVDRVRQNFKVKEVKSGNPEEYTLTLKQPRVPFL
jgi:hypothetical protein